MSEKRMTEDGAVARLRASDPGATAEPDADRLERLTSERRLDELAARRARGPRRWTSVAAMVAGALVVGGAGYGIGAASDPSHDGVSLASVGRSGDDVGGDDRAAAGPALEEAMDMAAGPRQLSVAFSAGRTTFSSSGLSTEAGQAHAWAFDGPSVFSADTAARAAEVLGVLGEPVDRHGGWGVGPEDGSGPALDLGSDGAVALHFNNPALYELMEGGGVEPMPMPEPDTSVPDEGETLEIEPRADGTAADSDADSDAGADDAASDSIALDSIAPDAGESSVGPVEPAPEPEPEDTADLTGEAALLHATLTELGIDADSAQYVSGPFDMGEDIVAVTAYQLVDGRRTGYEWNATVVDASIYSFSGPLAPVIDLGEYDVVSPAEAVDRLGDPRFGGTEVWNDAITVQPFVEEPSGWTWGDPPGAPPAAGAPIPWQVNDVVIVSAEATVTQQSTDDGAVLLLPAYELSDANGRTWSVLAMADHELAF